MPLEQELVRNIPIVVSLKLLGTVLRHQYWLELAIRVHDYVVVELVCGLLAKTARIKVEGSLRCHGTQH